jgi:hypothetical protein
MVPAMTRSPLSSSDLTLPQCGGTDLFAASGAGTVGSDLRDIVPEKMIFIFIFKTLPDFCELATSRRPSPGVARIGAGSGAKFPGSVVALQGGLAYVPASLRAPRLGRLFFESAAQ